MSIFERGGLTPVPMKRFGGAGDTALQITSRAAVTRDELLVGAVVENKGASAVYLLDAPWRLDRQSAQTPDAQGSYRSLLKGTMRVCLCVPPVPSGLHVFVQYMPLGRLIEAGGRAEVELSLKLPVAEYNPYMIDPPVEFTDVRAEQVELVLQFVTAKGGVTATPAPWWPGRAQITPVPSMAKPSAEFVATRAAVQPFAARQMVAGVGRLALPGEQG